MNILKKKLATEPTQADNLSGIAGLFSDLHNEWARQFGNLASLEVFPEAPNYKADTFKDLTQDAAGLFYALGDKDKPCQILVELSAPLARNVANAKFDSKASNDKALTLFDMILMQPIAETALRAFTSLGIAVDGPTGGNEICGRCIGADALATMGLDLDIRQKWLCTVFPLKAEDEAPDEVPEGAPVSDNTIKIYFAQAMIQPLAAMAQSKQNQTIIDPADPWARHMRGMIMDTTQMLEVVIEDITMSIADCTRLRLGQIIALPGASHTRLNVNARSSHGVQVLASSTLGVYKANKAVKLLEDIDPAFLAGIADIEQRKPRA